MTAQDALAAHRLSRARDALAEADVLVSAQRWTGALNRLYYALFYAAGDSQGIASMFHFW